jgi:zinc protease
LLAAFSALIFSPPPLRADSPDKAKGTEDAVTRAAAVLYDGIHTATLPNGLRVYLKPIPGSPVVTTMVAYKVGSCDEDLDHTGLSHYLEHLMFKGTDKIKPGDIDRLTLRNGGANNAYTSEDHTIYFFSFAADRWEAALGIEADRMRNLRIDRAHEFEQEKGAVIQELQRDEDQPWDLEYKTIVPLLFGKEAPYGHPVIGERRHVREATAEVIKAHYNKWYYPNNAALVVVGGFEPNRALALIKELFGALPKGDLPKRKPDPQHKRDGPVHKEFESKFDVARMVMGFNTVRIGDPDFYALEVLQAVLSNGKTGRLYKKLVEGTAIASAVDTADSAGRYPGWFGLQVQLLQGKDRHEAEKLVLAELKRVQDEPVSAAELKRAQRALLAGIIFNRESVQGLADSIARGVTTNDLDYLKTYLPRVAAVTPADVQAAARKYFDPQQRVVVWSVPGEGAGKGAGGAAHRPGDAGRAARNAAEAAAFSFKDARRVVLPNGLTLLLFENHRLPIVVADASVHDVRLHEPEGQVGIATLTGRLLDEGTARHSGPEIAELIENVGGTLSLNASGGSIKVLAPDRHLGLGLLFECLAQANFPKDAFQREQAKLVSEIKDTERQPEAKAQRTFQELVYHKHPYSRPSLGRFADVQKLTAKDCADFYHSLFVPNNTVVAIVGDFDSQQVIDEVTKLTADWKKRTVAKVETPAVDKPGQFTEKILPLPAAAQLHFYMGHVGIRRDNPDYYKLLVMDYVLGTGPGFTDRLSSRLRDREGLAYTVTANISSSATDQPGVFTCYIGTDAENFRRVKEMFLEELNRIRDEEPKASEVEDAKKYLLGSQPFQYTTNDSIAGQLLNVERYHLGFDYPEAYRKAVAAVTPADVQAVARKYLDPKRMILVAAGAIDENGKPLPALAPPKP